MAQKMLLAAIQELDGFVLDAVAKSAAKFYNLSQIRQKDFFLEISQHKKKDQKEKRNKIGSNWL